jgi:hypothetical protein
MTKDFNYFYTQVINATINVDDIGNVCLLARNDLGEEYYLIINTYLGETKILNYGPAQPDLQTLPANIFMSYCKFDYNENKICKIIDKFINSNLITYVEETNYDDLKDKIKIPNMDF